MSSTHKPNRPLPAADALCMTLSMPLSRREVMRVGLFSAAGLLFGSGHVFGAATEPSPAKPLAAAPGKVKAESVIQIFLWGGMSHIDTWDPKPDAGYDYEGEFSKVIQTNVPGIQMGGLFP